MSYTVCVLQVMKSFISNESTFNKYISHASVPMTTTFDSSSCKEVIAPMTFVLFSCKYLLLFTYTKENFESRNHLPFLIEVP